MRVSIHFTAALLGGFLGLSISAAVAPAYAQQLAEHFNVPTGVGSTVSVATLRVPEKAWQHFAKAKEAAEHNHLAEAKRETQKAIAIAPNFAAAYLLRADALVLGHSFEEAIDDVREARGIEPDVMWAGVVLAGAYNGMHRYEDARLELRALHGVEAESWQAYYEAARSAVGLNDVETALYSSAFALENAPESFADAHLVRTNALVLAHRWSEAQAQMEMYLQSKGSPEHRAEVLVALEKVKRQAREEELQKLASR